MILPLADFGARVRRFQLRRASLLALKPQPLLAFKLQPLLALKLHPLLVPKLQLGNAHVFEAPLHRLRKGTHNLKRRLEEHSAHEAELRRQLAFPSWSLGTRRQQQKFA